MAAEQLPDTRATFTDGTQAHPAAQTRRDQNPQPWTAGHTGVFALEQHQRSTQAFDQDVPVAVRILGALRKAGHQRLIENA